MVDVSLASGRQPVREVDLIIVGGGTAGALLARALTACTAAEILVLEHGTAFPRWALSVPLASYRLRRPWCWNHWSEPQEALGGRRILYPMGRVLGGSSAVNAMIAAPGPSSDYDAWQELGCEGWSWSLLQRCWHLLTGEQPDSWVSVTQPSHTTPFTSALVEACCDYGLERSSALTGERSQTCGTFALFQRHRRRYCTAEAIAAVGDRRSLRVATQAGVHRIIFERETAVGVQCTADPRSIIRARMGVVLSAGVFGSPAILMRSGVGPADRLRAAGIKARHHLPGVGENLQDHIGVPVVWASTAPSPGRRSRWLKAALCYGFWRDGVMASNGCEGGAFLGENPASPDLEIAALFQSALHPRAVELSAILMHPESRGSVSLDPHRPFGRPLIDPNFLSHADDARRLKDGVEHIRAIAAQASLRAFGLTHELMPGSMNLSLYLQHHATTHFHPVGTCRMGRDDWAVVAPDLRVQGLRGLWVCDNSVVPRLPAGHSAATAMMIAARGAELIAGQLAAR